MGGPNKAPLVAIKDSFASCSPQQTCTRTFCVAIGSASDHAVDVEWGTRASVQSDAWLDKKDVDSDRRSDRHHDRGDRAVIDRRPGGALLHPVALLSIALLIVNDHFLKPMYAN